MRDEFVSQEAMRTATALQNDQVGIPARNLNYAQVATGAHARRTHDATSAGGPYLQRGGVWIDPADMSYEEIIQLQDMMGSVSRGATAAQIAQVCVRLSSCPPPLSRSPSPASPSLSLHSVSHTYTDSH
jgi:hypothetical protein